MTYTDELIKMAIYDAKDILGPVTTPEEYKALLPTVVKIKYDELCNRDTGSNHDEKEPSDDEKDLDSKVKDKLRGEL